MKKLNNIFRIALAAVLSVGFASCEETAPVYEPGSSDLAGCYGVYFPTQEAAKDHTLDPTAAKEIEITVMRQNPEGDITVPVNVVASADSIFEVPAIEFVDGQVETSVKITFPNVETAVKYSLTLEVSDPQYASLYAGNPVAISFSVFCVEWKWIGVDADGNQISVASEADAATVSFTEAWWGESFDDAKIKFYEVNGVRNCVAYRDGGIWNEGLGIEFNFAMNTKANGEGKYDIDVTKQYLGFDYASQAIVPEASAGAPVYFYDWYNYLITDGGYSTSSWANADDFYAKNGASYPRSYYDAMGGYYFNLKYHVPAAGGGWNPAQFDVVAIVNGVLRQDFTTIVSVGETVNGVAPVSISMGKDVASVKYAVLEGTVTDKVAKAYCDSIIADTTGIYPVVTPETAEFGLELAASGVYTLVVVPFDAEGVAQQPAKDEDYLAVPFTYVAAAEAEDYAAVVTLGVENTSAMHAKDGYTDINSFQFYIYGENIVEAKAVIFETAKYNEDPAANNALVAQNGGALSEEELALVNAGGLADLVVDLKPLTAYTMVVWASNGYNSTFVTAEYTTSGLAPELIGTGTYTYTCMFDEPLVDPGYSFYKDPNYENTYMIADWFYGVDFKFTCTSDTVIYVPVQYSGYTHASYGPVYVMGLDEYAGKEMAPHYYDAETKTFNLGLVYFVEAGNFGYGYETFTLDESEEAAVRARRSISSTLKNSEWGVKEFKTVGPQLAGKAMACNKAKKAEFAVKSAEFSNKSMKLSDSKNAVKF